MDAPRDLLSLLFNNPGAFGWAFKARHGLLQRHSPNTRGASRGGLGLGWPLCCWPCWQLAPKWGWHPSTRQSTGVETKGWPRGSTAQGALAWGALARGASPWGRRGQGWRGLGFLHISSPAALQICKARGQSPVSLAPACTPAARALPRAAIIHSSKCNVEMSKI